MIDDTDREIIRHLQVDGRMPWSQLSQLVGLSDGAVRQRVNRLTEQGIIDIVAVTDPARIGFSYQAMLGLRVSRDVREVAEELGRIEETVYVVLATGRYDLLVEVVCRDRDTFVELVNGPVRSTPGVDTVEAFSYLSIAKQVYDWGVG